MKFSAIFGKALILAIFLFVVIQATELNARSLVEKAKEEGLTQKYISPEAKDWPEGFKDPQGHWTTTHSTYHTFIFNTRMVSEKEASKSYKDLLGLKWKGRIGMANRECEWYKAMMDLVGKKSGHTYAGTACGRAQPQRRQAFYRLFLSKEGQKILSKITRNPVQRDIEVDPVIEKVRRNLFPIQPPSAEEVTAIMKAYDKILLRR